jgi:hypothetical protein
LALSVIADGDPVESVEKLTRTVSKGHANAAGLHATHEAMLGPSVEMVYCVIVSWLKAVQ